MANADGHNEQCTMYNVQWKKVKLGNCLNIGNGCDYKHLKEGDIPVFGTGGIMTYVDSYLYDGETVCIGRKGTINHPMYHKGKIWTVDTLFYTHSFIDVIPKFVYYAFCNIDWNKYNEATGVPSLSKETIYKIEISVPSLPAQRRIAAILSAADKVIEQTRQLIGKYKSIKQGMMEDLLKPKEGWKKVKLGDCCITELGKTLDEGRNTGEYRPYLCALNVLWGKIDRTTIKQMRIEDDELNRYAVKKGDLLVCEGGEIGRCAIWDYDDTMYYQNALHRVRFFNGYDSMFFMYLLCYYNDLNLLEQHGKGLTIKHLNQTSFRSIPVSVPDLSEQRRLAKILSGIDRKIEAEEKVLEKYEKMKTGLMERLLKE